MSGLPIILSRGTNRVSAQPLLYWAIGPRDSVMLTKVFGPRTDHECLQVTVWNFQVPANPPSRRAIAATHASVFAHGFDELGYPFGNDVVFHGHQDRSA